MRIWSRSQAVWSIFPTFKFCKPSCINPRFDRCSHFGLQGSDPGLLQDLHCFALLFLHWEREHPIRCAFLFPEGSGWNSSLLPPLRDVIIAEIHYTVLCSFCTLWVCSTVVVDRNYHLCLCWLIVKGSRGNICGGCLHAFHSGFYWNWFLAQTSATILR